ncbi:MAG: hypothetical protein ACRDOP_05305, partial [Gaiellaceae bacterium]
MGAIDLTGGLELRGRMEVDLGGTSAGAFDRLTVSETAELILGTSPSLDVTLLPGFAPQVGDAFEILRAASILEPAAPLGRILAFEALGAPDLFLVPELAQGEGESLLLRVKQALAATWSGGAGEYTDASRWSFSTPPAAGALFPSNDGANLFDVRIDGGADGTASDVLLAGPATIESLAIDAGDRLTLADTGRLTFSDTVNRAESGHVVNDGAIVLGGPGASLVSEGDLSLEGSGVLELGGGRIGPTGAFNLLLGHGAGHTIRGSGEIDLVGTTSTTGATLANAGTIEATGASPLRIDAVVENDGVLRATGAGGLELLRSATNRGEIEVGAGGRLTATAATLTNQGELRVAGAGSSARASLSNQGLVEVTEGGLLDLTSLTQSSGNPTLRIADLGELRLSSSATNLSQDRLLLEEGLVTSAGTLSVSSAGRLEGDGRLVFTSPSATSRR